MRSNRCYCSKHNIIIILSLDLTGKCIVCLIDFHKFVVSSLIIWVSFGMVLQSKFSIGSFDLLKSGWFRNSQNLVVIVDGIREVFIEEFFLFFINKVMFIEEAVECFLRILEWVGFWEEFIIVGSFIPVWKNLESFRDIMKLGLGSFSVFFVFVRVPFSSQFFIGAFNFKERSVLRYLKNGIIILEWLFWSHEIDLLEFQIIRSLNIEGFIQKR